MTAMDHDAIEIDLVDATGELSASQTRWVIDHIGLACKHLRISGVVNTRVVHDAEMAAAHEKFSAVPGTTDVLTFETEPLRVASNESYNQMFVVCLDIIVCRDEALRQSSLRGYPCEREILLYIVHALLHGLGMDDAEEDQARAMHAREDEVLTAIGVGQVYGQG